MTKKKTGSASKRKALKSIEGFIDLPAHQRKTMHFLQGVRVRLVTQLPNGNTKVQLLEEVNGSYRKGMQVNLLPKCFVKKQPYRTSRF